MAVNFKGSLFGIADGDSSSLDSQLGIKFEVFFRFSFQLSQLDLLIVSKLHTIKVNEF